jgi:DNA repair exonuclease SbcCD ATPase subunit
MTYRDRRQARAERLRGWADKRQEKAEADLSRADEMSSVIPLGQPILVGHHSERRDRNYRDRIDRTTERGVGHARKADGMRSRADGIEAQLERSIYDDDPDAVERLEERIAELEAERERIRAYNASCRRAAKTGGKGDLSLLTEPGRAEVATLVRVAGYQLGPGWAMPPYKLANLSGNIRRNRERLAALKAKTGRAVASAEAGGLLIEDVAGGYCRVTFAERPDRAVLDALKGAGFRWSKGSWTGNRDALPNALEQ